MPILTMCAFGNKFYSMPNVGDMVVCLFASNADQTGTGWVIGSRFNEKSKPNANSQDVLRMDFKDGTFFEYNRRKHEMRVNCKGKVFVDAEDDVNVKTKGKVTAEADGKITLKSDGDIVFDAGGEIVFKGAKSYSLEATEQIKLIAAKEIVATGKQILLN